MSDIFEKKERYDYLLEQLTELEIKYSDLIENAHDEKSGIRGSIILKDIAATKKELEDLEGINNEYEELLLIKLKEFEETEDSRRYLQGHKKVNEEVDQQITMLQEVLGKHLEIEAHYEKHIKKDNEDLNSINLDLIKHKELIYSLSKYEITIDESLEITENEIDNWEGIQSLYDTKDMIKSAIDQLIGQKVELQRLKEKYIAEKVKE